MTWDLGIEHPDHTGASSNPLAPWNWPDAVVCRWCEEEMPDGGRRECIVEDGEYCEPED